MMRWNSTKTYTEEDMLRMQQEAVNRVHEFQSRARQALPFYDVPESAITPYIGDERQPPMPQNFLPLSAHQAAAGEPQTAAGDQPSMTPPPAAQSSTHAGESGALIQSQPQGAAAMPQDPISGLLGKLNIDTETLLIVGLMFLLYNEKADSLLLLALGYLIL